MIMITQIYFYKIDTMSELLDFNINYILSKKDVITQTLSGMYDKNLDIYGKQDFRSGIYIALLISLLEVDYLGPNTRRALYIKLIETLRKSSVTAVYKIPNTPPPIAINRTYHGVGIPALIPTAIQLLSSELSAKETKSYNFTLDEEVYYFAYPASFGLLSSILDLNGFETINGWLYRVETFIEDAVPVSYLVYEFKYITSQVNFVNTFKY